MDEGRRFDPMWRTERDGTSLFVRYAVDGDGPGIEGFLCHSSNRSQTHMILADRYR
jgi:hypothetical protein